MNFSPIFTDETECNLWSVCYPEDITDGEEKDIFSILFDERWSDVSYIRQFIKSNETDLKEPYWNGAKPDEIINRIEEERDLFDKELYSIETKQPGYENASLDNVFEKLHKNIYSIRTKNEIYVKGKPDVRKPILRVYGIELEDGTYIITGGTIKLKEKMNGPNFDIEFKNLERVKSFLDENGIINRQGLIDK